MRETTRKIGGLNSDGSFESKLGHPNRFKFTLRKHALRNMI